MSKSPAAAVAAVIAVKAVPAGCNDPLEEFCANCSGCTARSLYCLPYLQELVAGGYWDYLNLNNRMLATLDNYGWDRSNVADAILKMTSGNFDKVVPNCKYEEDPGPDFVDADQYKMFYDGGHFSLKLALVDRNGELAGLVTLHSS